MARIAGVDLPRDKRVEIALTYIFGIGLKTSQSILAATGINPDTIYTWGNEEGNVSRGTSEIYRKLNREREESLSARLFSNKGNPVGILGILNRHYGWNMGQPRGAEQKQKTPDLPGMERKYLEDSQEKPSEIPLPKQEF